MEKRKISTLPLAPVYKTRLHNGGYTTVHDLAKTDSNQLSKDIGLNTVDCESILRVIEQCKSCVPKPRLALHILREEESAIPIMTFSEKLDVALGGGIRCGVLTEICGVPGVGKTQLCLQLACDVQIPTLFGGREGEVIYIDTEGGFILDRVIDLVTATVKHCQYIASGENNEDVRQTVSSMSIEKLLAGIRLYSCYDKQHLLAMVNILPELLEQNEKVKLVIIDSVAFHFRHDFEDFSLRTRVLTNFAQTLIRTARNADVAIVVTNQMTTRVHQGSDKGSHLVPCLGESWGHACTTRLILQFEGDLRMAWLYKSPCQPQTRVPYQITKDGIRDIVEHKQIQNRLEQTDHEIASTSAENPSKRQKLL